MRLRTYTLHVPAIASRGDAGALDRSQIVPDGFSWPAFAFSVLWFLRYRLWLAALVVLVLLFGLVLIGRLLGLSPFAAAVVSLLASLLIGLEASSLRRWTYARQGRPARDAVIATSTDEAEAKLVARWLEGGSPSRATASYPVGRRTEEAVIGFFPASEATR